MGFFWSYKGPRFMSCPELGFFFLTPEGFQSNFIPKLSELSLPLPDSGEKVEKFDQKKNHGGCLWRPPWFFFWSHKGPRFMSCPELDFFFPNPRWVSSQTLSPHCQSLPYQYPILAKKERNLTKRKTMEAASGGLHGFFLVLQRSKVYELSRTGFFFPNPRRFLVKLYPQTVRAFLTVTRFW